MLKKILRIFAGLSSCYLAFGAYLFFTSPLDGANEIMYGLLCCYGAFILLYYAITGSGDPFFTGRGKPLFSRRKSQSQKQEDEK